MIFVFHPSVQATQNIYMRLSDKFLTEMVISSTVALQTGSNILKPGVRKQIMKKFKIPPQRLP